MFVSMSPAGMSLENGGQPMSSRNLGIFLTLACFLVVAYLLGKHLTQREAPKKAQNGTVPIQALQGAAAL